MKMKNKIFLSILWVLLVFCGETCAETNARDVATSPEFSDWPSVSLSTLTSETSKVVLKTRYEKLYKTVITKGAQKPSNFARNFRVVIWGCGSDCHSFAIVNKHTGDVYVDQKVRYVAGVMGNDEPRIDYRVDSRLLVLSGVLNDEAQLEGKFYYEWSGKSLKLISKHTLIKDDVAEYEQSKK